MDLKYTSILAESLPWGPRVVLHIADRRPGLLTLGAGGSIAQYIEEDLTDRRIWDVSRAKLLNIQLLDSNTFESLTGCAIPPTSIDAKAYLSQGLPFYDFYRERPVSNICGDFSAVRTLSQLDAERECRPSYSWDPLQPPRCSTCDDNMTDSL